MTPYIVTTMRHLPSAEDHSTMEYVERRAVATLEDRGLLIDAKVPPFTEVLDAVQELPESGGTVGPLPDGTVIEVERAGWEDLAEPFTPASFFGEAAIVAAFNAREVTR